MKRVIAVPAMLIRFAVVGAIGLSVLNSAALARDASQQTPQITSRPPSKNTLRKSCPDMARGSTMTLSDGGTLNSPQGWLYGTAVQNAPNGWTYLICQYGLHARQELRANNPVYEVAYPIPGYRAEECAVTGNSATCSK